MRKLAVVQCIPSELQASKDPQDYCISALKESGIVDSIVLAVPLMEGHSIFDELGRKWGVDVYYGSPYNVVERICNASEKYNPDIIVRCLLRRFYLDVELIKSMINKINEGYDYIELSNDVNLDVAADVSTFKALQKTSYLLKDLPNDHLSNSYRFNPWAFISGSKEFHTFTMKYSKLWDKERVKETKRRIAIIAENNEDMTGSTDENDPTNRYIFYSKWIEKNDTVLDIACGKGGGTNILSQFAKNVIGIDYNEKYMEEAKNRCNKKNLQFIHGTDELLDNFEDKFDKVVCAHTMEHVEDDRLFIRRIKKSLKVGGKLLLEVPRLAYYPLGEPLWPHHKREYSVNTLEKLLKNNSFVIEKAFGGKRHTYVDAKDAVESLFYVCRKL